jgi:hypothetical protein
VSESTGTTTPRADQFNRIETITRRLVQVIDLRGEARHHDSEYAALYDELDEVIADLGAQEEKAREQLVRMAKDFQDQIACNTIAPTLY